MPVWIGAKKSRRPPGFDPRSVQSIASCYTYYAIPSHLLYGKLSESRYDLKFCCSYVYVSCRSATCSRALTKKFIHVREVILESVLLNGQEISPLSAEYKEFWSYVAPSINKPDCGSYSTGFRSFVSYSTIETPLRWSCIADGRVRCDAVTRVFFCTFNDRNILFAKINFYLHSYWDFI